MFDKWDGITTKNLKGRVVKEIRVYRKEDRNGFGVILFEDGSYIQLEEQDYYSYHDCSMLARTLQFGDEESLIRHYADDKVLKVK